ncbi:hypothetical protein NDA13_005373 [Ustilago tritici]|nr:hypothetical protein NDA13_005373 [Ustilago tritici]
MKLSLTILLLTLFATLAVAAPIPPEFGRKVVEDTSETLSNHLSGLALNHPPPSSSQARRLNLPPPSSAGGRPDLTIPIRSEELVMHDPTNHPSVSRAGGLIGPSKKNAGIYKARPYKLKLKKAIQMAIEKQKLAKQTDIQNQERLMLVRQSALNQPQWDKTLEGQHQQQLGGSGSGRRVSSSPSVMDNSMDSSRFNDQDDTASSRFRY